MTRSLHDAALVTCLCWIGAWVVGSVPLGYVLDRTRLRRDLRRVGPADLRRLVTGRPSETPTVTEVAGTALDIAKVLGLVLLTVLAVRAVSPNVYRGAVPATSGIGLLAEPTLTVWQSAALWAGLAAAFGHLYPLWLRFRGGGQGQAPVIALAMRFSPIGFVIAVASLLLTLVVTRDQRAAVAVSLIGFVAWTWSAWLWNLAHWWGFTPGPELAIWSAVTAGVVASRALRA